MKLHLKDGQVEDVPVYAAKVGRRFESIELDAIDVSRLRGLTPENLMDWLDDWSCGFPPGE